MVHGYLRRLSQLLAAAILAVGFAVVMVGCGPKDKGNNDPNSAAAKQGQREMQRQMQKAMKGGGKGQ
jgi:hypothetical protein